MRSPLLWRRSATAVGIYVSALLGFLGTLVAARELGPHDFGLLAIVLAATGFFQLLLDLTVEEAVIKYGFRYSTSEDWGRFHRLFGRALAFKGSGAVLAGLALAGLAPLAESVFGAGGLVAPLLVAAFLPLAQAPEGLAGSALILRGRYDVRALFLAVSMALRLAAFAVGSQYGVSETVLAVVLAQVVATGAVGAAGLLAYRRFPQAPAAVLGPDRPGIVRFVLQSSVATGVVSLRSTVTPLLLGIVTSPVQVAFFRTAQAPQTAFLTLSAPARLILLTEQTRDWERGAASAVFAGIRRYTVGAALLMAALLPPLVWLMPDLIRLLYGGRYVAASDAARIIVAAAAVQLVVGWTKSLPVSIGRPGLRIVTHGIETLVLVPLALALGAVWDATGAAAAVLCSTVVFAAAWAVLVARLRREAVLVRPAAQPAPSEALIL